MSKDDVCVWNALLPLNGVDLQMNVPIIDDKRMIRGCIYFTNQIEVKHHKFNCKLEVESVD